MKRLSEKLWLGAHVLLMAGFLTAYSAAYTPPRLVWWVQLFGIMMPYLALLVAAATVFTLVKKRWGLSCLYLGLCVLSLVRFGIPNPFARTEPEPASMLTVMTFNTAKYKYFPVNRDVLQVIPPYIQRISPDLFCQQEANRYLVSFLTDSLGYHAADPDRAGHPLSRKLPILSKDTLQALPPIDIQTDAGFHTVASRAMIAWQGREAVVYNVHLQSFNDKPWRRGSNWLNPRVLLILWQRYRDVFLARAEEAEILHRSILEETHPVLVCGDFNATVHNWSFRRVSTGLSDSFETAGRGWGGTYHKALPLFAIDHLLFSEEWVVHRARTEPTRYSDHLPVVAQVSWH